MGVLAKAGIMGLGRFVYHQEAHGQKSLVNSDTLPIVICSYDSNYDAKAILEAAGVEFLGMVDGDSMFQ